MLVVSMRVVRLWLCVGEGEQVDGAVDHDEQPESE